MFVEGNKKTDSNDLSCRHFLCFYTFFFIFYFIFT